MEHLSGPLLARDPSSRHDCDRSHPHRPVDLALSQVSTSFLPTPSCTNAFVRKPFLGIFPAIAEPKTSAPFSACRLTPGSVAVSSLVVLSGAILGPLHAVGAAGLVWLVATGFRLAKQPEENLGHRAGAPGFTGEPSFASCKHQTGVFHWILHYPTSASQINVWQVHVSIGSARLYW